MGTMVSIIMPVYNTAKYINQAISSVIQQDYPNWELIIINDGSTDNTESIIQNFQDPRIRYFFQENAGVSVARNRGLEMMQGEFFCFLDADDVLTPVSISSRLRLFEKNENIYFVDGRVCFFSEDLNKLNREFLPSFSGPPLERLVKMDGSVFMGISWMFRRKKNKLYHFDSGLTHAEDLFFNIQHAEDGLYAYTNDMILKVRRGHSSSMKQIDKLCKSYFLLYKKLKLQNISPSLLRVYRKRSALLCLKMIFRFQQFQLLPSFFSYALGA